MDKKNLSANIIMYMNSSVEKWSSFGFIGYFFLFLFVFAKYKMALFLFVSTFFFWFVLLTRYNLNLNIYETKQKNTRIYTYDNTHIQKKKITSEITREERGIWNTEGLIYQFKMKSPFHDDWMVMIDPLLDTKQTNKRKKKPRLKYCFSTRNSIRTSRRLRSSSLRLAISRFCRCSSSIDVSCWVFWMFDGGDGDVSDKVDVGVCFRKDDESVEWVPLVSLQSKNR